jgi:cardiolipin synthase
MNFLFRNLPNILTILRIFAVPVFYVLSQQKQDLAAVFVFLGAEITDVLDGVIARHYQLITPFGKIADPFADKLMQLTALFVLAQRDLILEFIPWFVLLKDLFLLISGLYIIKSKKKVDMSSKWFGKLTSAILFVAIMLVFLGVPRRITDKIFWLCVALALFAALMYIRNYFKQIKLVKNSNGTEHLE